MNHLNETESWENHKVQQDLWLKPYHMRLKQFEDFTVWAGRLCAYILDKPVAIAPGADRRKTQLSPAYAVVFKTLINMFAVGEDMEYRTRRDRFDDDGFRNTCWKELQTRGSKQRTIGEITRNQLAAVLKAFQGAGIIERDTRYDKDAGRRYLRLRLRSDRVIVLIHETMAAHKADLLDRTVARIEQKDTRKNTNQSEVSESGYGLINQTSFHK
jgi:hypothetical protein